MDSIDLHLISRDLRNEIRLENQREGGGFLTTHIHHLE